jgi:hypothetical protein
MRSLIRGKVALCVCDPAPNSLSIVRTAASPFMFAGNLLSRWCRVNLVMIGPLIGAWLLAFGTMGPQSDNPASRDLEIAANFQPGLKSIKLAQAE